MAQGGSKLAVLSALAGNAFLMVIKFAGFALTGSAAMLSEAIHSVADLLNQILLYVGIVRSGKQPDRMFEHGYAAEQYVWALISAVGIFFLGCGVTIYHGVHSLMDPHEGEGNIFWAVVVLLVSLAVDGLIMGLAIQAIKKQAGGKPFLKYLRTEADPSAVAVLLEDGAACLGVIIALIAIVLSSVTGHHYWDAIGSILVGVLLGAVAIWLIARNRELLVGASIPSHIREQIEKIIVDNPAIEKVVDMQTRVLDTETYRIRANLKFDGAYLAQKKQAELEAAYGDIKDVDEFKAFAVKYADDLIDMLADEIDAIEKQVKEQVPAAEHLDLEAD
ncbi:MAG: cobalt transporter [Planctomycetaceae bacterium]|nr:cobalt transporter [Planctomycetaceae bacterium]